MKQNTKTQSFLNSRRIVPDNDHYNEKINRINKQRASLSVSHNNLALCLLDISKKLTDIHDYSERRRVRLEQLQDSVLFTSEKPWETDAYTLLEVLFSKEAAPYIAKAWHKLEGGIYQTGYMRRSFRAPHDKELYFEKKVNWIKQLWTSWEYDITINELAEYSNNFSHDISWLLAASIDDEHEKTLTTLLHILQGQSEVGTVSRNIIKALLLSDKPQAWEAVKQLLLTAQRQEGLRQSILECLDETSLGAMKFMLQLILEENLLRFSSVVRALNTWTGMNWESERKSAIKSSLEFGYTYLTSPEKIPEGIESKNNVQLYMALWAQGVLDVYQCIPLLLNKIKTGNLEQRVVALFFASQIGIHENRASVVSELLDSENLWDIYWCNQFYQERDFDKASKYYEKWREMAPKKDTLLPNKGFEWIKLSLSKEKIEQKWVAEVSNNEVKQQKLLPFIKDFSIAARERFVGNTLSEFSGYRHRRNKGKQLSLSAFQREVALQLVSATLLFAMLSNLLLLPSLLLSLERNIANKQTLKEPQINIIESEEEK